MSAWAVAFVALVVFFVCLVAVFAIGLHVVKKYPSTYDPARDARRFTIPVVIAAAVGLIALTISLVAVGIASTTP